MGRAIDMEKDIDVLKKDVAQLKTAFEGLHLLWKLCKIQHQQRKV